MISKKISTASVFLFKILLWLHALNNFQRFLFLQSQILALVLNLLRCGSPLYMSSFSCKVLYESSWAVITKYHNWDTLRNRHLFSRRSEGWTYEIRMTSLPGLGQSYFPGFQMATFSGCSLVVERGHKGHSPIGLVSCPYDLLSFSLPLKNPISRYNPTGLGL